MNDRESGCSAPAEMSPTSFVHGRRRRWQSQDPQERYLAAAADLADLERRMRTLEGARGEPVFVTFNH
jgi:Protein of unknown function (DUF3563)